MARQLINMPILVDCTVHNARHIHYCPVLAWLLVASIAMMAQPDRHILAHTAAVATFVRTNVLHCKCIRTVLRMGIRTEGKV